MKQRYKFRCYPTDEQKQTLAHTFGCCRFVYNWGLKLRTDAHHAGSPIGYHQSSAALTDLKRTEEHTWLNEVSCVPTQQALRHLNTAFANFFEKRSGYPTFHKKHGNQAAEYTRSAFKFDPANRALTIAKVGKLKVRWSRQFASEPTTVTITKKACGRYFVTLVLDELVSQLPKTGESIGVDLGLSRLATLSTGERVPNLKHLIRNKRKLARAQRVLARRKKGSGRYVRQRLRVARIHERIADSRADHLQKLTTDLVKRFDVICIEDLNVRGMVKNHSLARSLSDASFGAIRRMLEYKCTWYGKELRVVDRFFPSSKRCADCGWIVESLPLSVREWECPSCSARHDRDENAARNILAAGQAVTARGGDVRPVRASARKGGPRRSVNQLVSVAA